MEPNFDDPKNHDWYWWDIAYKELQEGKYSLASEHIHKCANVRYIHGTGNKLRIRRDLCGEITSHFIREHHEDVKAILAILKDYCGPKGRLLVEDSLQIVEKIEGLQSKGIKRYGHEWDSEMSKSERAFQANIREINRE